MSQPGSLMRAEIAEQPARLAALAAAAGAITEIGRQLAARRPRFALLAARGTSDHAALYTKYLVETVLAMPAGLVSPSTYTIYRARPDLTDVLFVAVSQSGRSPDLVQSLITARECGALTLAVTNDAGSDLATAAEAHVDIAAGPERSVAATKTYTTELLALYLVVAGLAGRPVPDLGGLPDAGSATLDQRDAVAACASRLRFAERIVTTGRGLSYPTAREGALKLMETCAVPALAFSGADLLHGPLAMVNAVVPVIAVAAPGEAGAALESALESVRSSGGDVIRVAADGDLRVASAGIDPELVPVLEIMPLQLLALELALSRGDDPDQPRGLNKVTKTW